MKLSSKRNTSAGIRRLQALKVFLASCLFALRSGEAQAQAINANVTLAINTTQAAAAPIPSDFSGLSFEMGSVIYDGGNNGWYLSGTNSNMVALMKTLGVKSIRVGGNSAESGNIATNADEDAVLDFCHAIGGNLIWDLEIDGSLYDPPGKAAIAQSMQNYVNANNYGSNILVFQVGNEPDLMPDPNNPGHNMGVTTYDSEFSNYVAAVNGLYSGSRWAGPDTAGGGTGFSGTFCPTEAAAWPGQIAFVCQHDYPFGTSLDTNTAAVHISWMLAAGNEAGYKSFNNQWVPPAFTAGLAPRYEECNSFFHNGSFGASDAYASALWGLGWMYFHANAGLAGINFHTGENANNPAYNAITPANLTPNYTVHPLAYAIAAFNLGAHGRIVPVTIGNSSNVNLVAYSVLQNDGSLVVTVINREYTNQPSPPAHNAALAISTSGTTYNAGQVMFLTGMNNDPSTTSGVTLGGSAISGSGVWTGTYLGMARPAGSSFALTVPAAQAAIIHLFNAAGPAAPANLTATAGNSQATLTWSNSPGATGYIVQRSSTTGGPYTTVAGGVTTNSYTDTGLTNGLSYYYVVAATNNSGIGPQSAEAVATLSLLPPLAPAGLAAIPGNTMVTLSWNASAGATNYILLISTNSDGSNSNLISTLNTNYLNLGLNNGTTYYYAVSAVGPYGQSPFSALVSATPNTGIAWTNTITTSPQSWNVNANWINTAVFPNSAQAVAIINSPISANQTINLNQTITIGGLNIGASSGAGSFNIAGGGSLTFSNASGTALLLQLGASKGDTISAPMSINGSLNINNSSANPLTLSGSISGANNFTVNNGAVDLNGSAANTYTGTTTVNGGALLEDFSNIGASANLINSSSALVLGGGTLQIMGNASSASSQAFNGCTLNAGYSVITAAPASGANNPTIALNALTDNAGGMVEFVGPATIGANNSSVAATAIITTTTEGNIGINLDGIWTGNNSSTVATVGLYDWASTDTTSGGTGSSPYAIIGGSQVTGFYANLAGTVGASGVNYNVTGNSSSSSGTTYSGTDTLRFNTASAITFTVQTYKNWALGGILVTPNVGVHNVTFATGGSVNNRGINNGGTDSVGIFQNNTLGELIFNDSESGAGYMFNGSGGYFQAGPGTVVMESSLSPQIGNNYAGATYLNGGVTEITADSMLGGTANSPVILNGGTLLADYTGNLDNGTMAHPVAVGNNGGGLAAVNGFSLTVDGVITNGVAGAGALVIGIPASSANGNVAGVVPGTGSGTANTTAVNATGTVIVNNTGNTYTGGTIIDSGILQLTVNNLNVFGTGGLTLNGGTFQWNGVATDISSLAVTLAGGGGTLDVNGNTVTLANPIGNSGSGALTVFSSLANGVLNLSGANTYTGGTTVTNATLEVNNNTGSATGSGSVTVASGATLAGNGSISGAVTVNSGGILAPGNPLGTLTISNSLKLAAGSTNIFEISNAPLTNDVANIFGALTNGGTLIVTNIGATALASGDSFKLFSAASYNGAFAKVILPSLPAGLAWNTNSLNTSGTLAVAVATKPFIASADISGDGFAFTGTGGVANANFYLLGSTNLSTPVTNWTCLLTNQFDGNGNFNFTNFPNNNSPLNFYLLRLQ